VTSDPEQKPTPGQRIKDWFGKLLDDPFGTLVESAVWIFMLAMGVFLVVLFARMGWEMIQGAWR
jgi:hypothetical protein